MVVEHRIEVEFKDRNAMREITDGLAEFLAREEEQPERYQMIGGAIKTMTGGTVAQNRIVRTCARAQG